MNKNSRNFIECLLRFLLRPDQWRHQVNPCQAFQDNRKFENIISEIFIPKNVLPNRISDTRLKVRTEIHLFYLLGFKFLKKLVEVSINVIWRIRRYQFRRQKAIWNELIKLSSEVRTRKLGVILIGCFEN